MSPKEKMEIDRISRVLEAHGWSVTAVDTRGEALEVTVSKPKAAIT